MALEPGMRFGHYEIGEPIGAGRSYDISPDGERFLMVKAADNVSAAPKIVIVENWLEELARLVPTQ